MDTPDAKRLKALEAENAGLKKLLGGVACKTKSLGQCAASSGNLGVGT